MSAISAMAGNLTGKSGYCWQLFFVQVTRMSRIHLHRRDAQASSCCSSPNIAQINIRWRWRYWWEIVIPRGLGRGSFQHMDGYLEVLIARSRTCWELVDLGFYFLQPQVCINSCLHKINLRSLPHQSVSESPCGIGAICHTCLAAARQPRVQISETSAHFFIIWRLFGFCYNTGRAIPSVTRPLKSTGV